jgi:hypothetical protein
MPRLALSDLCIEAARKEVSDILLPSEAIRHPGYAVAHEARSGGSVRWYQPHLLVQGLV